MLFTLHVSIYFFVSTDSHKNAILQIETAQGHVIGTFLHKGVAGFHYYLQIDIWLFCVT